MKFTPVIFELHAHHCKFQSILFRRRSQYTQNATPQGPPYFILMCVETKGELKNQPINAMACCLLYHCITIVTCFCAQQLLSQFSLVLLSHDSAVHAQDLFKQVLLFFKICCLLSLPPFVSQFPSMAPRL